MVRLVTLEGVPDDGKPEVTVVNRRFHSQPGRWCNGDVTPTTFLDTHNSVAVIDLPISRT